MFGAVAVEKQAFLYRVWVTKLKLVRKPGRERERTEIFVGFFFQLSPLGTKLPFATLDHPLNFVLKSERQARKWMAVIAMSPSTLANCTSPLPPMSLSFESESEAGRRFPEAKLILNPPQVDLKVKAGSGPVNNFPALIEVLCKKNYPSSCIFLLEFVFRT